MLALKGLDLGGREKRTDEERYQIVSKVTTIISDKVRKDVKRCIQRREDTYTRAQTLIEQVAKNKYNSRERDATHLVFGPLFGCYRVRCVGQQDLKSISLNMEVTPLKMIFLVLTIGVRNVEKINFRYQEKDINYEQRSS